MNARIYLLRVFGYFIFPWVIVSGILGCTPKMAQVSGTVTFDGKPIKAGSVILYCPDQQMVRGIIGSDGSYTIPNVPRGMVVVTVRAHAPIPAGFQLKQQLPPSADGPIAPTTVVGAPSSMPVIPERYGLPEESGLILKVDRAQVNYPIELRP